MNQKYEVYFHVGLPKVASTFLQNAIFPHLTNIVFHRKRKFNDYKTLDYSSLTSNHFFSCEHDREGLKNVVVDITRLFPDAKFLFFVRRHDKWILSKYKYYIRKHGHLDFKEFFDLESDNGIWRKEDLLFKKKITYIEKHCKDTPLVLPHVLLREDQDGFFERINQYMGTSLGAGAEKDKVINKAFNDKQLICLRKFNRFYRYKKAETQYKFVNKLHYKFREAILFVVAFFCRFIPQSFISSDAVVCHKSELDKIRDYFKDDWNYCLEYSQLTDFQVDA